MPRLPRLDIGVASPVEWREAERARRRARRHRKRRAWRWLCGHRISLVFLVVGTVALVVVGSLPDPVCVMGGSHDGCLGPSSYWTLWLVLAALLLMINEAAPDIVLLATTTLLLLTRVITEKQALQGVASPSVLAIGVLFVVARALEETRAVELLLSPLLGSPKSTPVGVLRLCIPVALCSAFLNNTPIVAMLLSVCEGWAARNGLSIHALLMPLSFASMLGGMCTLIGTSTNLVLNAQIENDPDAPLLPFTMFSMTAVGAPVALLGVLYMALAAPILLRPRTARTTRGLKSPTLRPHPPPTSVNFSGALSDSVRATPPTHYNLAGTAGLPPDDDFTLGPGAELPPAAAAWSASAGAVPATTPFVLRGLACYCVEVHLGADCLLLGQHPCALDAALAEKGQKRATEVVGLSRGALEYSPGLSSACGCESQDLEAGDDVWRALRLEPGDCLLVSCLGDAVPRLRALPGVTAAPDADALPNGLERAVAPNLEEARLGRRRNPRSWRLVEAVVSASSPLSGLTLTEALATPQLEQTIFWGIRHTHAHRHATPTVHVRGDATSPRLVHVDAETNSRAAQLRWSEAYDDGNMGPPLPPPARHAADDAAASAKSGGSGNGVYHSGLRYVADEDGFDDAASTWTTSEATSAHHVLHPGCTLLLEAPDMWVENHRTSRSFALLGVVGGTAPTTASGAAGALLPEKTAARFKLAASLLALVALLALSSTGTVSLLPLALALAFFLVGVGCITLEQAWRSISFRVLLTIACSFGLGSALQETHVSAILASGLIVLAPVGAFPFLLLIFFFTSLLSCVVSNAATVVLLYSVLRDVQVDGLRPAQTMLVMMLGASSAFATPIGYQTNLMVLARGGYRFGDFAMLGGGLTLLTGFAVSLIVWALPETML